MARSSECRARTPCRIRPVVTGASEGPSAQCGPGFGYVLVRFGKKPRSFLPALAAGTSLSPFGGDGSGLGDGSVLRGPPDAEMVPPEQHIPPRPSPQFDLVNSKFAPLRGDGRDGYMPHVHTPKRSGVGLDAPSPQRVRINSRGAEDLEAEDLVRNTGIHVLGWPTYKLLFGDAGPGARLTRRISAILVGICKLVGLQNFPAAHSCTRRIGGRGKSGGNDCASVRVHAA